MALQNTPLICDIEPSEIKFPNSLDHKVIACSLGLCEKGEVEYINASTHPCPNIVPLAHYQKAKETKVA